MVGASLVLLGACADPGGSDSSSGTDSGADSNDPDEGDDSAADAGEVPAPEPGTPADAWESAYEDGGVRFSCDDDEASLIAAGVPAVGFGDAVLYVGFEQIGDNQNPLLARFDAGVQAYCERHETEPPDGRAVGLTWDGGATAYLVYTIVGGGSSLENKGGWLPSYAPGSISGGGPKVSVVGRVTTADGLLDTASFIIAVTGDNKVNSHGPRAAPTVLADGNVEFLGGSAHKPIDADGSNSMACTDYPFDSRYVLTPDLGALVCASCSNCNSQQPCE
jgi:hypothetical protein